MCPRPPAFGGQVAPGTEKNQRWQLANSCASSWMAGTEPGAKPLAADLNIYGIVSGAVPAPHSPFPDLTADLTVPGRAYDNLGLLGFLNTHVSAPTGAHNAAAIAATPHNNVSASNVQAQLQEENKRHKRVLLKVTIAYITASSTHCAPRGAGSTDELKGLVTARAGPVRAS